MTDQLIDQSTVDQTNDARRKALDSDYAALGEQLDRRGIKIDEILAKVEKYTVAIPSWGVGTGGTRFARFPGIGEPRDIFDKIEDCAIINELTRATPTVSLHIPWDKADPNRLKQAASRFGLSFDAKSAPPWIAFGVILAAGLAALHAAARSAGARWGAIQAELQARAA